MALSWGDFAVLVAACAATAVVVVWVPKLAARVRRWWHAEALGDHAELAASLKVVGAATEQLKQDLRVLRDEVETNSSALSKLALQGTQGTQDTHGTQGTQVPLVLQAEVAAPNVLPLVAGARTCANCAHFDVETFVREVAGRNPVFAEVMRHRSPNELVATDEDGPSILPLREDRWDQFGVCVLQKIGLHRSDTCDQFELVGTHGTHGTQGTQGTQGTHGTQGVVQKAGG